MTLDPHQIHAATLDHPRVRCLAAAGSGKTSVLVERVCWLLDQGTRPTEILALTFTRKAGRWARLRRPPAWQGAPDHLPRVVRFAAGTPTSRLLPSHGPGRPDRRI